MCKSILLCSSFLLSTVPSAVGATALGVEEVKLRLNFVPNESLVLTPQSTAISGELNGYGFHYEQWGLRMSVGNPVDRIWFTDKLLPDDTNGRYGDNWSTQTVVSPTSWSLTMLVEAFAIYPPVSYASAKSWAGTGTIMEVFNPTDALQTLTFTVVEDLWVNAVAIAESDEYAAARAVWDFKITQNAGALLEPLVDLEGEIFVSTSLGGGFANGAFSISADSLSVVREKTYTRVILPGERAEFRLEEASVFTEALAVPEPATVWWAASAALGAAGLAWRRRRMYAKPVDTRAD